MAAAKMLGNRWFILMIGLVCFGCQGSGNPRPQPRTQSPPTSPTARRTEDFSPTAPLQIPGPPPAPAEAVRPKPLTPPENPQPVATATPMPVAPMKPDLNAVKTTNPPTELAPPPAVPTQPPVFTIQVASVPSANTEPKKPVADTAIPAGDPVAHLKRLQRLAEESAGKFDMVTARLTRREQVNGKEGPEELLECKFRKEPFSIYFHWIGQAFKGREVIFVKGQYDSKIHTWMAPEERLFGVRRSPGIAPDSPLIRSRSRYTITSAGIWAPVAQFTRLLTSQEQGDTRMGKLTYLGTQKHTEYSQPMETVEQVIPAGAEAVMPGGGKRTWVFDLDNHLPVLLVTKDDRGQVVEYYCYEDVQPAPALTDDDFNPDKLWSKR